MLAKEASQKQGRNVSGEASIKGTAVQYFLVSEDFISHTAQLQELLESAHANIRAAQGSYLQK